MKKYATIEKRIGETPLEAAKRIRGELGLAADIPLAYAGRLDPMASGKLLILIDDECKRQSEYHNLDKAYDFSVLFGVRSDTADVLGIVEGCDAPQVGSADLRRITKSLVGPINLPYPHFSSKTVQGKPLHVWTLEGRLNEIEIPTKTSAIYKLNLTGLESVSKDDIYKNVLEKIETVTQVTDESKALGRDFRRVDVRAGWKAWHENPATKDTFQIAHFHCIAGSGTYMRTLAEVIAKELGTCALAHHIHRTHIGKYQKFHFINTGFWTKKFD